MATYTQILYQIVFSTYRRRKTMTKPNRRRLYQYIYGILRNNNCHVYRINGVEDHLHIVTHIHPMVAPAMLIKDIKLGTDYFIKQEKLFPGFDGWQKGYGAFTYSIEAKNNLIEYVKRQEEHHRKKDFIAEYKKLLEEHQIEYDERYLL